MQSHIHLKRWASYVLFLALAGSAALAQSDNGTVNGTIEDATGAVVPGSQVKLTNQDTGAVKTATSDAAGNFTFPAQPRGNYKVDASHEGFATVSQQFTLNVSQVQALELKLAPGTEATQVQVTDAAPIIDLADSTIGEDIAGRQVTELPLNGRNFTSLALLTPGVTRGNYGNPASGTGGNVETFRNNQSGGGSLSSNGLRPQADNFLLDGVDNNEALVNTLEFFPNIDGTEEFKVNTSTAPAEFGRAGGSVVQSSIKSGTNAIHGSAFEFARSSLFDASPNYTFLGAPATPALPFKRNTFGGSVGFPIFKDKLFLFGDYQGLRDNFPLNPQILTVPTAAFRTGDFSALLNTGLTSAPTLGPGAITTTAAAVNGAIYDPISGLPFQGNIIPGNRLNPAAVNYLNAYPLPNLPGTGNGTENNYRTIRQNIDQNNTFDARADADLSQSDRAFFRFTYDNSNFTRTSEFANLPAGFASGSNFVHARGYALGETHTFSPNIINEFRAAYNRYTIANVPVFSGVPIAANLGIVNANRNANLGGGALIGGNGTQLEYTGDYGTYVVPENTYQFNDAVTILRGRHSFKFGGNGIRRDVAFFRPIAGKGFFQLGNSGDFTGFDTSELLVGFADNYSIGAQNGLFDTRNYEIGAFVQDDWKATQRLTLNLGIRWDLLTFPFEVENRQAALNPTTGTIDLAGVNGVPQSIINNNFNNFGPRVGFAYDLYGNGRTVVRGGYGIFYFLDRGGIDNQLGQQVPFGGSVSYAASAGNRITLTGQTIAGNNSNANATQPLPQPGYPNFNPNVPPAGINIIAVNRNEKTPNVQQYDLQLQQQFGEKTVITIGYVGNKSTHLSTGYNYNTNPSGATSGAVSFPTLGQVILNNTSGVSNYNSLQAQLNYKVRQGFTFTSSYTFSHNLDNTDGYLGFFAVSPLDAYNTRANHGNSSLDQRNVFVASALYDLPFGHGHAIGNSWGRGLELAAGGWQVNSIVQVEGGTPFTIENNVFGQSFSPRPNAAGPIVITRDVHNQYFTGSFTLPPAGTPGNVARNAFYGPGLAEGDLSVFKNLHFVERVGTELRGEIFNITNTPQFAGPDTNLGDAVNNNGVYTIGPSSNFGHITSTRQASERQIQVAVRFTF